MQRTGSGGVGNAKRFAAAQAALLRVALAGDHGLEAPTGRGRTRTGRGREQGQVGEGSIEAHPSTPLMHL